MERNPFEVMDLAPDAGLDAARRRYKALARRHHPDTASGERQRGANRAMAQLNRAMEQLEQDFEGWRRRAGFVAAPRTGTITVEPRLLVLNAENGFAGYVTAATTDVPTGRLTVRFPVSLLTAERLPGARGVANFRIALAPAITHLDEERGEVIEVVAEGCEVAHVRVAVSAFRPGDVRPHEETAWLLSPAAELGLAAAAFAGALAIVVLSR